MYRKMLFVSFVIFFSVDVFGMESVKKSESVESFVSEGADSQDSHDSHEDRVLRAQKSFDLVQSRMNSAYQIAAERIASGQNLFEPDMVDAIRAEVSRHNAEHGEIARISVQQQEQLVQDQQLLQQSLSRRDSMPPNLMPKIPDMVVFQFLKGKTSLAGIGKMIDDRLSQ